jgi:hypothetical protein
MMEVYAAATAQCDYEIGRVLDPGKSLRFRESGRCDGPIFLPRRRVNGSRLGVAPTPSAQSRHCIRLSATRDFDCFAIRS